MITKRILLGAAIAAAGWIVGDLVTRFVFADSPAVSAYAGLVGWWLAAYLASKFEVPITSTIPLGAVYFIMFIVAALLGKDWFYHDIQGAGIGWILVLGLAQAVMIASPILFDWIVGWLKRHLTPRTLVSLRAKKPG